MKAGLAVAYAVQPVGNTGGGDAQDEELTSLHLGVAFAPLKGDSASACCTRSCNGTGATAAAAPAAAPAAAAAPATVAAEW